MKGMLASWEVSPLIRDISMIPVSELINTKREGIYLSMISTWRAANRNQKMLQAMLQPCPQLQVKLEFEGILREG